MSRQRECHLAREWRHSSKRADKDAKGDQRALLSRNRRPLSKVLLAHIAGEPEQSCLGGIWNSLPWRAESRGGHHHRYACVTARKSGSNQGGSEQSITNQFELGTGICARNHWPDDPGGCRCSIALGQPLELGLDAKDQVLLALTLLLSVITLGTGRTTVLQGIVHLVIFTVFLFFAVVP